GATNGWKIESAAAGGCEHAASWKNPLTSFDSDLPPPDFLPARLLVLPFFATLRAMRVFISCFLFVLSLSVSGAELRIDFDRFAEGQTPTNFHGAIAGAGPAGNWRIVMDNVPPTLAPLTEKASIPRRAVLAQTSADATDERFPMFIYDGQAFK